MTALSADKDTKMQLGDVQEFPVLTATTIYGGALTCLNAAGYAVPGATATTLVAAGRAEAQAANAGASGAINVKVRSGVFRFENSADTDEITIAQIGDNCYIVDDQTVAKTDDSSSRSVAGKIVNVDSLGVWVRLGL